MNIQSTLKLNNGVEIPRLGLGVFRSAPGSDTVNAVRFALEAGYRHIDTAAVYKNEESVGQAVAESGIAREDIFITTKLWTDDIRADRAEAAFDESLKKLKTDYVDLYLVHWPVRDKMLKSWQALEKIYQTGRVRAIGVSNFHEAHLAELLPHASIIPAINQMECHPSLSQLPLQQHCAKHGIAFEAWSPLGGSKGELFKDERIAAIGAKYNKSAAQTIIRWHLQRDIVVIPKSVNQSRIIENGDVFDFELTKDDMDELFALNQNHRFGLDPDSFKA